MGLQLRSVLAGISGTSMKQLIVLGLGFSVLLILLRLLIVWPGSSLAHFLDTHFLDHPSGPLGGKQVFILGWTGMRGVVALAAALSLPVTLANGRRSRSEILSCSLPFQSFSSPWWYRD